jgi:hypothetical protein
MQTNIQELQYELKYKNPKTLQASKSKTFKVCKSVGHLVLAWMIYDQFAFSFCILFKSNAEDVDELKNRFLNLNHDASCLITAINNARKTGIFDVS